MNEEQKQLIDEIIDQKHKLQKDYKELQEENNKLQINHMDLILKNTELQKDFDLLLLLFEQHTDLEKTKILNELETIKHRR